MLQGLSLNFLSGNSHICLQNVWLAILCPLTEMLSRKSKWQALTDSSSTSDRYGSSANDEPRSLQLWNANVCSIREFICTWVWWA